MYKFLAAQQSSTAKSAALFQNFSKLEKIKSRRKNPLLRLPTDWRPDCEPVGNEWHIYGVFWTVLVLAILWVVCDGS